MEGLSTRLAIVSHIVPPATYGTAMRMHRLLRNLHSDDYRLLVSKSYKHPANNTVNHGVLPAKHFQLPLEKKIIKLPDIKVLSNLERLFNNISNLLLRAKRIASIVKQEKCQAIMAFSGDLIDLPAALIASRFCGVPFYAAIDDYYMYQWTKRVDRFFAQLVEPLVLKGALRVMVLNDFLKKEYHRRYRVKPVLVYNPNEDITFDNNELPWTVSEKKINIIFTGAVYHANFDAFENLVKAIKLLNRPEIKLHIYSSQPKETLHLEDTGISGPVVFHGALTPSESLKIQRKADILFLPLGFTTNIPKVIKTSAPFKMGEYMTSGRPILAHAPHDSFLCWYFKKHKCGLVVDKSDPTALAKKIESILNDAKVRQQIVKNARNRAQEDFDIKEKQTEFLEFINFKQL